MYLGFDFSVEVQCCLFTEEGYAYVFVLTHVHVFCW